MPEPTRPPLLVVFGATGDLMHRKLLPALYGLCADQFVSQGPYVLGVARSKDYDDASFQSWAAGAISEARRTDPQGISRWCQGHLRYLCLGEESPQDFARLKAKIAELEKGWQLSGDRVFYLALPLQSFQAVVSRIGESGLAQGPGTTRLVIEKPFGRDLASARDLNQLVHRYFPEPNVFRIDHYLGKETVQNLLVFRFSNMLFESLWNRDRVESVEINVAEDIGIEARAASYEESGALRDMVQNHLTQLLTLTAMEAPSSYEADAIRNEKVKALKSIAPLRPESAVFGQYTSGLVQGTQVPGYREEPGVSPNSSIETFVALTLEVHTWRWHGVPFILRTGKRLARRLTEIRVKFRQPPVMFFKAIEGAEIHSNELVISVQPDEGFDLTFEVKSPGPDVKVATEKMSFRYAQAFAPLPDGYQTLLLDVFRGDTTLFVRADEVEASWAVYAPLLEHPPQPVPYAAGSSGPAGVEIPFDAGPAASSADHAS